MSKHTPGPWTTGGESDPLSILSTASYLQVAEVNDALDEAYANARLIAANPCLLAAAMEAKSAMDSIWQTHGREDDWIYDEMGSELSAGYFSLRYAIAKARGDA